MLQNEPKKARLFSLEYLFYDFVKITAVPPGLVWLRPKWIYENDEARKRIRGGALVIANHTSFIDPVAVMAAIWYRRHHFVCLDEFFKGRWAPLFRGFRCIPINREDFSMDSMRAITDVLRQGKVVSLFPSGRIDTSTPTGNRFKSGVVLMAMQSHCPIVPVYIKAPKSLLNRLVVAVGEPIDITAKYGPRPDLRQIREINDLLWEKETLLKNLCERS